MADRGIILPTWEVQAVRWGTKTQLRRPLKVQPQDGPEPRWTWVASSTDRRLEGTFQHGVLDPTGMSFTDRGRERQTTCRCPYGHPGDTLWARETWSPDHRNVYPCDEIVFRADRTVDEPLACRCGSFTRNGEIRGDDEHEADCLVGEGFRWRSPVLMPRRRSRIDLCVTGVRVARLHAITEAEAQAEGVASWWQHANYNEARGIGARWDHVAAHRGWGKTPPDFRGAFGALWSKVYGSASWDANPWVWVVDIEVIRGGR
jgi:hypothetical protein